MSHNQKHMGLRLDFVVGQWKTLNLLKQEMCFATGMEMTENPFGFS